MVYKSLLKRLLPFGAALVLGLFVASFFVAVSAPQFNFKKRQYRHSNCWESKRLKMENRRLRDELRFERMRAEQERSFDVEKLVPPPPPLPAPPAIRSVPYQSR